jgi:hypothetical protein
MRYVKSAVWKRFFEPEPCELPFGGIKLCLIANIDFVF